MFIYLLNKKRKVRLTQKLSYSKVITLQKKMTFYPTNQTIQCRIFYKMSICQGDQKDTISLPVFKRLLASKLPWQPQLYWGYSVLLRSKTPSLEKENDFARVQQKSNF